VKIRTLPRTLRQLRVRPLQVVVAVVQQVIRVPVRATRVVSVRVSVPVSERVEERVREPVAGAFEVRLQVGIKKIP